MRVYVCSRVLVDVLHSYMGRGPMRGPDGPHTCAAPKQQLPATTSRLTDEGGGGDGSTEHPIMKAY